MHIYVPFYDDLEDHVSSQAAKYPEDVVLQRLAKFVKDGAHDNGSEFRQMSEDGSNVDPGPMGVFCVASMHAQNYQYPKDFFDKYTLVMTFNVPAERLDVFCTLDVDPELVYKTLQANAQQKGIKI